MKKDSIYGNVFLETNEILIIDNTKIYYYEIIVYKFLYKNLYMLIKNKNLIFMC